MKNYQEVHGTAVRESARAIAIAGLVAVVVALLFSLRAIENRRQQDQLQEAAVFAAYCGLYDCKNLTQKQWALLREKDLLPCTGARK